MSDEVTMRRGGAADAAAIRELTVAAYAKWTAVTDCEPLPVGVDYAQAVRHHRFDLLSCDGELAGLIETTDAADHLLIVNVAVRPSCQGRGFGRRLLAHAEQLARDAGFSLVRLYINKLFDANLQLYQSLGYRADREDDFKGRRRVHMSKPV